MRTLSGWGLRRLSRPFSAILLFGAAGMVVVVIAFAVGPRGASGGRAPSIAPLPTSTSSPATSAQPSAAPTCAPASSHGKHGKAPAGGGCAPSPTPDAGGDGGDGG